MRFKTPKTPFYGVRCPKGLGTAVTMPNLKDQLRSLQSDLQAAKPEASLLIREAINALSNQEVAIGTLQSRLDIAHKTLDRYADPVFWLRLPPSTFATADKGQMARQALSDMVEEHSS